MDVPTPHQGSGPALPLRVAVVGTGNIARLHAEALRAEPERAEIVSAVDVSAQALDTFRERFAVPTGYTDPEEMLRKERPDLVHVCTPPGLHRPQVEACLGAGASVLVEKPPALSLAEAEKMAAAEGGEQGPWMATVFQHRFGSGAQHGEDPLTGGRFAVQSYLEHHGRKLARRFDANSYVVLTEVMNRHDIGRDRGGVEAALRRITADLTVVVVDSDRLFTPADGERIAASPASRGLVTVHSPYGHDAFLIATDQVFAAIGDALADRPVGTSAQQQETETPVQEAETEHRAEVRPAVPFQAPGLPPVFTGTGLW